jgi:signal transduction histidine kinase
LNCGRSLSSRLVLFWILGTFVVYFSTPITTRLPLAAFELGDPANRTLESWTTKRGRDIVVDALRRARNQRLFVENTAALSEYRRRNPEFRFAVIEAAAGAVVDGSSEGLAKAFLLRDDVEFFTGLFHLPQDQNLRSRGFVRRVETPMGALTVVTYGAFFHWDDVFYQALSLMTLEGVVAYLPFLLAVPLMAVYVVRRGLKPLKDTAAEIAAVDFDTLDHKISTQGVPAEVAPFVDAVNRAFRRIEATAERKQRFTANAAHELRTPITVLRARVEKLDEAPLKHEIARDVRRIQTIVEQMLLLSQLRGQHAAPRAPVDLGVVALNVAADYVPIALAHGRDLKFEGPPETVLLPSSRWAIESIIGNLVENALRAEPEGGVVVIRARADASVEVEDHGPGVAAEDRTLIFEPYWRKSGETKGVGLGLAIVRELVDELGGRISVLDAPGGGALFRVALRPQR